MAKIIKPAPTLFTAENARVIYGDALNVMRDLPAASFDAVVTDPPYSTGGGTRGKGKGACNYTEATTTEDAETADFDDGTRDPWAHAEWSRLWMAEALRLVKPGGWLLVFCDWRGIPFIAQSGQMAGWLWQRVCVWDKVNSRPMLGNFDNNAEFICCFSNGRLGDFKKYAGTPRVDNVFTCTLKQGDRLHPTAKPLEVMRHFMGLLPAGAHVLDPFCGGGATLAACEEMGFRSVGIEITPHYAERAAARLGLTSPVPRPAAPFFSTSFPPATDERNPIQ